MTALTLSHIVCHSDAVSRLMHIHKSLSTAGEYPHGDGNAKHLRRCPILLYLVFPIHYLVFQLLECFQNSQN